MADDAALWHDGHDWVFRVAGASRIVRFHRRGMGRAGDVRRGEEPGHAVGVYHGDSGVVGGDSDRGLHLVVDPPRVPGQGREEHEGFPDASRRETWILVPMAVLCIALGVLPQQMVFNFTNGTLNLMLNLVTGAPAMVG